MYSPDATALSHPVSQLDQNAAAWSLTKIINPLGSEIEINYERDDYANISGDKIVSFGPSIENSNAGLKYFQPFDFPIRKLYINHNNFFSVGDVARINAFTGYLCPGSTNETFRSTYSGVDYVVTEVGVNFIKLDADFIGIDNCGAMSSGQFVEIKTQFGQAGKVLTFVKGGDIRVGSIVTRDDMGVPRKIRYLYKRDDGYSSGVISKEPEYVGISKIFYDYPEYPQTPVLYGTVSILAGNLTTDTDFDTKQTYEFETPHQNLYSLSQNVVSNAALLSSYNHTASGVIYNDKLNL
jgi:hypothetical protein